MADTANETVTERVVKTLHPETATKETYHAAKSRYKDEGRDYSNLDWVATQGRFQSRPSDLFLKMYAEALKAAHERPESAVVSPTLLGTSGVVPLSIISVIPDIMLQYADCIKAAKDEVLIATNAWEPGRCVDIVVAAIRELNSKCTKEGRRVVVRLLMDAASIRNALQSRYPRPPKSWPNISLPAEHEVPSLDMEVINYHVAPLGTFHSKFAIIDRQVALVNSNNINLRSNVEMMTRFEGDVVNSLYDTFLISWGTNLKAPLPCLSKPAPVKREFMFAHSGEKTVIKDSFQATNGSTALLSQLERQLDKDETHYSAQDNPKSSIPVNQRLNVQVHIEQTATDVESDAFHPYMLHPSHDPLPMALVNRQPHNLPGHGDVYNPQNNAWLAGLKYAKRSVFIQSPVCNASPVVAAIADACKRGIVVTVYVGLGFNDFAEGVVPFQNGTNEEVLARLQKDLRKSGPQALQNLRWHWYVAKDQNMPVRFEKQARNCHVKFFNVDDEVAIMGSGNQDTQSWFHSQEVNVMIDSKMLCKDWEAGFKRIQNTDMYGLVDHDVPNAVVGGGEIPKKHGFGGLKRSQGGFL